jgi:tetratricopeptide (TPR) repeat protein
MARASLALLSLVAASGIGAGHVALAQTQPNETVSANQLSTQPVIGPVPDWVTPVPLPAASAESGEAAMRLLLLDEQVFLDRGRQIFYSETAVLIQAPAGLDAGNLSFPWRPETDVLTIHKIEIRRGSQVIDVLASGQTFTVMRREPNLEIAMLDGVLTANLQPEGLQVGDVLHIAASISRSDPTFAGHVETAGAAWNAAPIERAHFSVRWPQGLHVEQRVTPELPSVRPVRHNGLQGFDILQDDVEPLVFAADAPPRFAIGRLAAVATFTSWSEVAGLMAPLYERASVLSPDGRLQAEVARIRALSADPVVQAEAALALVQDRVRYVALLMAQGGLTPADAETTWARRFGDCKAKTALLIALLHALEIEAEPVAVSSSFGDGLDQRLPMIGVFDHVLVRATIAGRTYWLDGTRQGDTTLTGLQTPSYGWGLPLVSNGAALVPIMPAALDTPDSVRTVTIDARAGIMSRAQIHVELLLRGDAAVAGNAYYANATDAARDTALRQYWRNEYRDIEISTATVSFDPRTREQRYVMDGSIGVDWARGGYAVRSADVGYRADFTRADGPYRDAPFATPFPFYSQTVETVLLPSDVGAFTVRNGESIDQTVAGISYRRSASIIGDVFRVETSQRSVAPEFPAAEAQAAQTTLRALADRVVQLVPPSRYRSTDSDAAAQRATAPTDAAGYLRRAVFSMTRNERDQAIADFNRALELEPNNATALAMRAMYYVTGDDMAAARRDLDAASALEPAHPIVLQVRGMLAREEGATTDAIAAYTAAIDLDPDDALSLANRAEAYRAAGDDDRALADANAALRLQPNLVDLYLLRANIHRERGETARMVAEAHALGAAAPERAIAHVMAGRIFASANMQSEAMSAFDRAIAIEPQAYIYVNRAMARPASDFQGRRTDADEALRLDPNLSEALALRAELLERENDHAGALADLTTALRADPQNTTFLTRRGISYVRAGRDALAEADFAAARAHAVGASELNSMCWAKATAGVGLNSALADCDAALNLNPENPSILDSRAFVLLRLDRLAEAIAVYDRALSLSPRLAPSLYGRSIARRRQGDQAGAEADRSAAIAVDGDIAETFETYGIN